MPTLQERIDQFFADPLADVEAQRRALDAMVTVPDIAARDAIPLANRPLNLWVKVEAPEGLYRWDGAAWEPFSPLDALLPAPVCRRKPTDAGELLEDMALLGIDVM
ncbi:conserved protein of unknown function [Magnetospirillum sp. XM-1]|uniref:hypothetical protein n=1 Tax=Magnetospirillum sp. XM-1 TaxID=1663591 RepID=UPI00073DDD36|nr:hypothetical protein [Magnetospirillum sp. XM-1]CUW37130.1 conserved protein of unknown function [Magnetospirillum sp. XM-1]